MWALREAWRRFNSLDPRLTDAGLAAVLAAGSCLLYLYAHPARLYKLPLVAASSLALVGRRRWPLASLLIQAGFNVAMEEPPTPIQFLGYLIGMYSVGVYGRWRLVSFVVLVGNLILLEIAIPTAGPPLPRQALNPLIGAGAWLMGNAIRDRKERLSALEDRARRLQRERELAAQVAVADERSRIARELHDVVAHSVSVMVIQAGAARRMLSVEPQRAADALRSVESSGREALSELRRLLGVMTSDGGEAGGLAPQPGLAQLASLVERLGSAGLSVSVRVEGSPRSLPPGLDLTAYRILQEALTNVLKHARGARAEVLLRFEDRELALEVVDAGSPASLSNGSSSPSLDASPSGAGRGLLGMQERVAMFGGSFEAGRLDLGGFAVRARLPLEAS